MTYRQRAAKAARGIPTYAATLYRRLRDYPGYFGMSEGLRLAVLNTLSGRTVAVNWAGDEPLTVRMGGSDLSVFLHVIGDNSYEPPFEVDPKVVIDAGANIGLATAWFANRYPNARVIAIEPEQQNFDLLAANTECFANVEIIRAALWKETGSVSFVDPDSPSWAFQVAESSDNASVTEGTVPAISVDDLFDTLAIDHVDLFKIDIEGSELEVFMNAQNWIEKVDIFAIELHDLMKSGCSKAFYDATRDFKDVVNRGEDTFVSRL